MPVSNPIPPIGSRYGPYAAYLGSAQASGELSLDARERVGGPVPRRRVRYGLKALLFCVGAGGIWIAANHQQDVVAWSTRIAEMMQTAGPPPSDARSVPLAPSVSKREDAALPLPEVDVPPTRSAVVPENSGVVDDGAAPLAESIEKLPPVVADPEDPLQKRALAAGLHPGLSRALLQRLTAADFRNAEHAIRTALLQAAPSEIFVWPRQRPAGVALFKVKFVAGAARECRRYVVVVLKDGWETTAMPMERCGEERGAHRG